MYELGSLRIEPVPVPFRWNLRRREQLGGLPFVADRPDLWYWYPLVRCSVEIIGRSRDGYIYFVGRSLDSVYDFLTGALADTGLRDRIVRIPISCKSARGLSKPEAAKLRGILTSCGITPQGRLRAARPSIFCDTVDTALTFTNLFDALRAWIVEAGQWDVFRHKVGFLGVVKRNFASPDIWRWYQHMPWARCLPRCAVGSIALDEPVWEYLTNHQPKINRSYTARLWGDEAVLRPPRDETALAALAEAHALVRYGERAEVRRAVGRLLADHRAMREPWLRALVRSLRTT